LEHYPFEKTAASFQENPIYEATIKDRKVDLVTLIEESVYAQNLTELFCNLELIVFISRHSSLSGTPTLSVHTPGNLGDNAELGGFPRKVSVSPANAMKDALKTMAKFKEEMQLNYEVSYECTHHGPSLNVPTMFAELGSSPTQWNDLDAAETVAHAAMDAISNFGGFQDKAVLGIGGPHYNMKFTRMALEGKVAFGHIIPKYAISWINTEILQQCLEKTLERIELVTLDWKGIKGEDKPKLVRMLEEIGIPLEKV
jgi:D-aminoacyl-tRNA deacylase